MDDTPSVSPMTPPGNDASELAQLKAQYAELSWQTHTLRVALLVVATAVCAFFWLEAHRNGQALEAIRPQAAKVVEANKVQDPIANKFVGQLVEFGKAHPDFAAILNKYGIRADSAPTTVSKSPAPAAPKK